MYKKKNKCIHFQKFNNFTYYMIFKMIYLIKYFFFLIFFKNKNNMDLILIYFILKFHFFFKKEIYAI